MTFSASALAEAWLPHGWLGKQTLKGDQKRAAVLNLQRQRATRQFGCCSVHIAILDCALSAQCSSLISS